jgi:trk system potassium uptake protein TrkA
MKIIIVGLGRTGLSLIKNLVKENHDIVVIDTDGARVQDSIEKFDVNGVVGNGCLAPILEEAGAATADLLIAVTDRDAINILSCLVGKSLGTGHLIAQVREPEYYSNFDSMGEHLGINMFVNLEATLARKITRVLKAPAEADLNSFASGRLEIAEFTVAENSRVCGKTLSQVRSNHKKDFLVVSIVREDGEEAIVPNGFTQLLAGDVVNVCAKHHELRDVLGYFGLPKRRIQSVMILGSGERVYYLASELLAEGLKVKVIGKEREQCEDLKSRVKELDVICDDYNNKEVLEREGLDYTDALVAVTPSDENNIVASLYAKTHNMKKIVTVVTSDLYKDMLDDVELNLVVSPYELAGLSIAKYIRSINVPKDSQIISMRKIAGEKAEALQFNIGKNPAFVGKKISVLAKRLKSGVLMCAVIRKHAPIIPNGDTVLEEDDYIIVASLEKKIEKLEDLLK